MEREVTCCAGSLGSIPAASKCFFLSGGRLKMEPVMINWRDLDIDILKNNINPSHAIQVAILGASARNGN